MTDTTSRSHRELMIRIGSYSENKEKNDSIFRETQSSRRYRLYSLIVKALGGGIPILGAILQAGSIVTA